jgi:hypothetical protein
MEQDQMANLIPNVPKYADSTSFTTVLPKEVTTGATLGLPEE